MVLHNHGKVSVHNRRGVFLLHNQEQVSGFYLRTGLHMYLDDSAVRATLAALGGFAKRQDKGSRYVYEADIALASRRGL